MTLLVVPKSKVTASYELRTALERGHWIDLKVARRIASSGVLPTLMLRRAAQDAVTEHLEKSENTEGLRGLVADIRLDRVKAFNQEMRERLAAESRSEPN